MDTVAIDISRGEILKVALSDDYHRFHYGLHKGLTRMLYPADRRGIDVVFIYNDENPSIKSLCKKIRRFWHNYRKTKSKATYYGNKNRTQFHIIGHYEDSFGIIEWYEAGRKAVTTTDFKFRSLNKLSEYA